MRRLTDDLEDAGLAPWLDADQLRAGDSIVETISDALRDADALLVIVSQASTGSRWVGQEWSAALAAQLSGGADDTVVIPALLDDAAIPSILADRKFADFRADYDAGLAEVVRALLPETD